MHGHGVAVALWSAVRRMASVPGGMRAMIAALVAAAVFPMGARASVEYEFTGGDFTYTTGVYTTSDQVTGEVTPPAR